MQGAIAIQPATVELDGPHGLRQALEIDLMGEPSGLVIILCEPGTLHTEAAGTMNALAEHGYSTIAVEACAPTGPQDDDVTDRAGYLIERATSAGWEPDQIGVVGFGQGGRAALLAALAFPLGAAVSISPTDAGSVDVESRRGRSTPWLGLFGRRDPLSGTDVQRRLSSRLGQDGSAFFSVVTYDTDADFYRDSSDAVVHEAAFDSWQRTVEWLQLRVAPRLTPLALAWRERRAGSPS
jgi:carboxymethylenebutenolidase